MAQDRVEGARCAAASNGDEASSRNLKVRQGSRCASIRPLGCVRLLLGTETVILTAGLSWHGEIEGFRGKR